MARPLVCAEIHMALVNRPSLTDVLASFLCGAHNLAQLLSGPEVVEAQVSQAHNQLLRTFNVRSTATWVRVLCTKTASDISQSEEGFA